MTFVRTEDDLVELRHHAQTLAVVAAWAKRGYFDQLADGMPHALTELEGDPRALSISARILGGAGLLVGDGERWALSPAASSLLGTGALRIADILDVLGDLSQLDRVLAEGGPARTKDGGSKGTRGGVRDDQPERSRAFLRTLHRRSADTADECARWVAPRLPAGGHVLDLGGGHGRYARAFASMGYRATLFDRPLCVELARELNGDAIEYRSGDFHEDDLGGPYDAVLLSNIVHGEPPEANARLVSRIASRLRLGGVIVVKDMLLDDLGTGPQNAVLFGMTMLLYTEGGRSYSAREVIAWYEAAGLAHPHVVTLGRYALAIANRPR